MLVCCRSDGWGICSLCLFLYPNVRAFSLFKNYFYLVTAFYIFLWFKNCLFPFWGLRDPLYIILSPQPPNACQRAGLSLPGCTSELALPPSLYFPGLSCFPQCCFSDYTRKEPCAVLESKFSWRWEKYTEGIFVYLDQLRCSNCTEQGTPTQLSYTRGESVTRGARGRTATGPELPGPRLQCSQLSLPRIAGSCRRRALFMVAR